MVEEDVAMVVLDRWLLYFIAVLWPLSLAVLLKSEYRSSASSILLFTLTPFRRQGN